MNVNDGSSSGSVLCGQTAGPGLGKAADVSETVPAESHHGEGEDQPGGPEGQGVKAAEGQANIILSSCEGVRFVNCRYRLHQKCDDQIAETNVGEK